MSSLKIIEIDSGKKKLRKRKKNKGLKTVDVTSTCIKRHVRPFKLLITNGFCLPSLLILTFLFARNVSTQWKRSIGCRFDVRSIGVFWVEVIWTDYRSSGGAICCMFHSLALFNGFRFEFLHANHYSFCSMMFICYLW